MSPRRSRSGGTCTVTTCSRKSRSSRKRPLATSVFEIAVGRRDDAHVDLDGLGRADAADLALLQHAQELHLHLRADLADLVEEQRPALGLLEEAALRARWRP